MTGKLSFFLLLIILIGACSKNNDADFPLQGVWVEKTYRLDTFDFEKGKSFGSVGVNATVYFRSKPFTDPSLNPIYPINNSAIYSYYATGDSMFLRNFLSSSSYFQPFHFKLNNGQQLFEIGKFYARTGLLSSVLEFEKIQ